VSSPPEGPLTKAYLLDIEGTTTPIEFVYRALFPYAREHARDFLRQHSEEAEVRADVDALRAEHAAEKMREDEPPEWRDRPAEALLESTVAFVHWLMDRDRKSTGLKSLQGKIWKAGYLSGELRGEVYPDVVRAFLRWRSKNKDIAIFSSGSILAQKLLFANTAVGDLAHFIRAYFDTTTGRKNHPESYSRISSALGLSAPQILFVSDTVSELDAARLAGMQTRICVRPGSNRPSVAGHSEINTFDDL
jgi:enolase-phosphatase E1